MNRNGISGSGYFIVVLSLVLFLPGCGGGGGSSSGSAEMDARPPAMTPVVTPPPAAAPPAPAASTSTTTSVVTPPPPSTRFDWPEDWSRLSENTDENGDVIDLDAMNPDYNKLPLWEGVEYSREVDGLVYTTSDSGPSSVYNGATSGRVQIIGIKGGKNIIDGRPGWTLFYRDQQPNRCRNTTCKVEFEFYGHEPAAKTYFSASNDLGFGKGKGFEQSSLYSPITEPPYDDDYFDYHSVKVWSFEDFFQGMSKKRVVGKHVNLRRGTYGFIVHGERTKLITGPTDERMPTTDTFTYRGAAGAFVDPGLEAGKRVGDKYYSHSHVERYEGKLELTVRFDDPPPNNMAAVVGRIYSLKYRPFGEYVFQALPEGAQFVIENGMVPSGSNTFTADIRTQDVHNLQFTGGEVSGRFYGPGAEEVGGTFRGDPAGHRRVIGWFGGAKE